MTSESGTGQEQSESASRRDVRSEGSNGVRTGPYLVTTKRPEVIYGDDDCMHIAPEEESRRATGTLGEAREAAADEVLAVRDALEEHRDEWEQACEPYDSLVVAALAIPESGGTVGPLPDGTLIQVEPVEYIALWWDVPYDDALPLYPSNPEDRPKIIAAWNARQSA